MNSYSIFQYIRGALRSAYGQEELREKSILFVGVGILGQELLLRFCLDGTNIFFSDLGISNYHQAHTICRQVSPYGGEPVDLILDFEKNLLTLKGKQRSLLNIGQDPYTQGIHDFYL